MYLVAGGYDGHTYLSSTEIMVKGSNLWTEVGGLSYGARGMRAVSWENTVLVFGIREKDLVVLFKNKLD